MNSLNKKIRKNRLLALIPLISFLSLTILPLTENLTKVEAVEFSMSVDFLVQTGISLYDKGRYLDAMNEFKKALIIDPNSTAAKEFLNLIQKELFVEEEKKEVSKILALKKAMDKAELKKEFLKGLPLKEQEKLLLKEALKEPEKEKKEYKLEVPTAPEVKPIIPERTITLDEQLKATQPNTLLEIERDSSVLIKGDNIKRFLNITPEKLQITRQNQNSILITAIGIGKGIFHVWDNAGRWTFNFNGKHKKFFGTFGDEYQIRALERGLSEPFKINYSFDWSSFHTGRRVDTTQRQTLFFNQSVSIRGETPYGRYDGWFGVNRLNKQYEINYLGMGLTDAHFWGFEHLNIRIFDFNPGFTAFKFPSADLRGFRVDAPMFNDKLYYTAFRGGLPKGNYTRLSPGLGTTKDAYLEGVGLRYQATKNSKYKFYYTHSRGPELNQPVLTDKAFGLGSFYKIGRLNFDSEVAYDDADHISYTSSAKLTLTKTSLYLNFREEDRDFVSPLGGSPAGGSTNAKFGISFFPTSDLSIANNFSATRDRDLFNPNDPKRPNYTFDSDINWKLDPHTSLNLGFNRSDTKGTVSPGITESKRLNLRRQLFFIRKLDTYLNYTNTRNKYFSASATNYDKDTISSGLGLNIFGDIFLTVNKSINFIEETITKQRATPHVLDTSLSYYSRILDTPFYGRFRVSFRDEEKSESAISFLSGEDRLEFFAEFDYRPNPYIDGYLSLRASNVWAETANTAKHLDAEVRYGLRLTWDTGLRWNTKGHADGYVFNDLDGDSIKDQGEEGIGGVVISESEKNIATTNEKGYYKIKNIVGKKARISLDIKTIPRGYILTTPSFYDIDIKHGATKRADFGITTRSEIVGSIFVDFNGNNRFDRGDEGLYGVVVILDDVERVVTDQGGQYLFRGVTPGEHTLAIDLKTLPTEYIPKVPLKQKMVLEEGVTFFYNVPLRTAKQIQ